jgi:hypothetical protein
MDPRTRLKQAIDSCHGSNLQDNEHMSEVSANHTERVAALRRTICLQENESLVAVNAMMSIISSDLPAVAARAVTILALN